MLLKRGGWAARCGGRQGLLPLSGHFRRGRRPHRSLPLGPRRFHRYAGVFGLQHGARAAEAEAVAAHGQLGALLDRTEADLRGGVGAVREQPEWVPPAGWRCWVLVLGAGAGWRCWVAVPIGHVAPVHALALTLSTRWWSQERVRRAAGSGLGRAAAEADRAAFLLGSIPTLPSRRRRPVLDAIVR